jgi:hypothetical protein
MQFIAQRFRGAEAVCLLAKGDDEGFLEGEAAEAGLTDLQMTQDDDALVLRELVIQELIEPANGFLA